MIPTSQEMPAFFLAVAYWLHMLATVVWLGGLSSLSFLVVPAARRTLDASAYAAFLGKLQPRLQTIAWLSLAVLSATGMFQMSANPSYGGFLTIDSPWAIAMLSKHLIVGLMIAAAAYSTWGLLPAVRRMALLRTTGRPVDEIIASRLEHREARLLQINLLLSVIVLALTALARAN